MTRRRKITWLAALLVLCSGIGAYYCYWQSTAIDRKVCGLVYEYAGYPDTKYEKFLKKFKLDFLLREKPKSRDWEVVLKDILAIGNAAIPELICLLNDDSSDDEVRRCTANILGCIRDDKVVDPLIRALQKDKKSSVRRSAAVALGSLGDKRAVEALCDALLKDNNDHVCQWVADALGRLGDPRAIEPLKQARKKNRIDYYDFRRAIEEIRHCRWEQVNPDDKGGEY